MGIVDKFKGWLKPNEVSSSWEKLIREAESRNAKLLVFEIPNKNDSEFN